MELSPTLIVVLVVSGILVGFINAISAGATAITIALYLFLGFPPTVANATNRISVMIQCVSASLSYRAQKVLDTKRALILALPTMAGAFLGALLAARLDGVIFERAFGLVLLLMLAFIFYDPKKLKHGNESLLERGHHWKQFVVFFLIGIYGGFVQVGTGFFFIMAGVLMVGCNIIQSNAIKSLIMLLYSAVCVAVFWNDGLIRWDFGLIHGCGAFIGGILGSRMAVKKGVNFIRWITVGVIVITALQLFGILDFKMIFSNIL